MKSCLLILLLSSLRLFPVAFSCKYLKRILFIECDTVNGTMSMAEKVKLRHSFLTKALLSMGSKITGKILRALMIRVYLVNSGLCNCFLKMHCNKICFGKMCFYS